MSNINVSNFDEDLRYGEAVEQEVLQLIQKKNSSIRKVNGNFKSFDLYIPEVNLSIEVKYDIKSDETGNFFIECEFNGEPSGIQTTTAEWWILVDGQNYYFIETESLGYLIQLNNCYKRTYTGKDGTKVSSYLLRKDILYFSPYVKRIPRKPQKPIDSV